MATGVILLISPPIFIPNSPYDECPHPHIKSFLSIANE